MDWLDFAILSDLLIVFIQRTLYDTVECLKHLSDCIWSTSTAPKGFQSLTSWTHIVVHYLECTNIVLGDRKSTRLNSSHVKISYAVFCLKKKRSETKETCELYS